MIHFYVSECISGFYGQDCSTLCGFCLKNETCNHVTGLCSKGCAAGHQGDTCKQGRHFVNWLIYDIV